MEVGTHSNFHSNVNDLRDRKPINQNSEADPIVWEPIEVDPDLGEEVTLYSKEQGPRKRLASAEQSCERGIASRIKLRGRRGGP